MCKKQKIRICSCAIFAKRKNEERKKERTESIFKKTENN